MSLVLPLRRLDPEPEPTARLPRTLHLDVPAGLDAWTGRVREATEACLLVDPAGRVTAMSGSCGDLLVLDPADVVGALLRDLLDLVDCGPAALPVDDVEHALPPLRTLTDWRLARGLVRVRSGLVLRTYDVVSVPLSGGAGALAFVAAV